VDERKSVGEGKRRKIRGEEEGGTAVEE